MTETRITSTTTKDRFGHSLHKGDLVYIVNGNRLDLARIFDVHEEEQIIEVQIIEVQIIQTPEMRNNKFPRRDQIAFISDEYRDMEIDYIAGLYGIKTSTPRPMLAFDPGNSNQQVFDNTKWVNQKTTWRGAGLIKPADQHV